MEETPEDLAAIQSLLDRSYAAAGPHLAQIHTPQRRATAEALAQQLTGMRLLVLSTVTADGKPITGPVDGIFYRGAWYFGSAPDSVRFRHIRTRPFVSATHLPGEEFAVTVHGRAEFVEVSCGFRRTLLGIYVPRYGERWEHNFLDSGPQYARIDAERMFAFVSG